MSSFHKLLSLTEHVFQKCSRIRGSYFHQRPYRVSLQHPSLKVEPVTRGTDLSVKKINKVDHETLRITFSNNVSSDFKNIWLRDSCQCELCVHPVTRQKLVNINDLNINSEPVSVSVDDLTTDVKICWPEHEHHHTSLYSAKWLYQFCQAFDSESHREALTSVEYTSVLPPALLWDKDTIEKSSVKVSYDDFMNHQFGLFTLLSYINAYGIAIITDVPLHMGQVLKVAQRISFVKETTYGLTFQVISKPDPKTHLSYTNRRFELHTDLSYMQNAPSIQLLHCLEADHSDWVGEEDARGISFFADAYHSATWLRKHHPQYFDILSNTKLLFTFQDAERGRWFRMERPLIEANHSGEIIEMYWSDFSMRPPLIPLDQIVPFYKAYRCLANKLNEDASLWKFFLKPGDLVIFNNKRVLHGRDEYDATKVKRHLEGCYIDLQEAMSLFESLLSTNASHNSARTST